MAFYADRLGGLDRRAIRERVIERFSAARMTDRYEELYARMAGHTPAVAAAPSERPAVGIPVIPERDPDLPAAHGRRRGRHGSSARSVIPPGIPASKPSIAPARPRPRPAGSVLARIRARTFGGPARPRSDH